MQYCKWRFGFTVLGGLGYLQKMFHAPRKAPYVGIFKFLARNSRSTYSGRTPQFPALVTYKETNNGTSSAGYGEKEIFLLGPADTRTPLPGNTGIPPLSMFYNDTIRRLPQPAGEKNDVTSSQLPEERYRSTLAQAACVPIQDVLLSSAKLECIAYDCPQLLKKDFSDLFPNRNLSQESLTVMTLCRKTENDMSQWSETAELERENLGKYFIVTAQMICDTLKEYGYWADFIHPNSGKPYLNHLSNSTMLETDLRYRHFGFNIEDLGCCKVISHFDWGTHAYIGAIFTNAPLGSMDVTDLLGKLSLEGSDLISSKH